MLLASFSFLLPVFFSSFSLLFCSAFLFLKAGTETNEDDRCWSFCAQPMVAASGDSESDGHAGFGLYSFYPSTDAFSRDEEDDGDEGMLCWWSCRPCLCVFLAFDNVVLMAFSVLPLSRFFLSFFSCFSLFFPFFFYLASFFFHSFSLLLFYCLPSWSHSNARMKERNSLCFLRFCFTACLSCVFLVFLLLSPPLGQQPRLLYSLYMALFRKKNITLTLGCNIGWVEIGNQNILILILDHQWFLYNMEDDAAHFFPFIAGTMKHSCSFWNEAIKTWLQLQKSGVMIKENSRNLQRKKGNNSAGKVHAGKKSDGGGVVLKMTIVKMRAKHDQLPYFPFLIESLLVNFFIRQNFFLILSSINFLILEPFPFGPWSKKNIQIGLQLVFKL